MPKFSEETIKGWTKPASDTEETKLSNAERMVREAIAEDEKLKSKSTEVFGQGSYANDTNVKRDSDIDINVRYKDGFYYDLPSESAKREDFDIIPHEYTYREYKDDVENALVRKFGRASVVRKNKCLMVEGNTYRVETDVVPTWDYRRYSNDNDKSYVSGGKFFSDDHQEVVNFPKKHIENGKTKNSNTSRRFKRLTRVHKKIRYKMIEDGITISDNISSFLLECLVYNTPDYVFNNYDTWTERLKYSVSYLYGQTENEEDCKNWCEVSERLYLFISSKGSVRKCSFRDVNQYMVQVWNYMGFGDD